MANNLMRVFNQTRAKEVRSQTREMAGNGETVNKELFLDAIVFDQYFEPLLNDVVRLSVDGDQEIFDTLLLRINTTHKSERLSWNQFLAFFSRRGTLREGEQVVVNYKDPRGCAPMSGTVEKEITRIKELLGDLDDENIEETKEKLKQKLAYVTTEKQNKVPKHGKGKYNLTVP